MWVQIAAFHVTVFRRVGLLSRAGGTRGGLWAVFMVMLELVSFLCIYTYYIYSYF